METMPAQDKRVLIVEDNEATADNFSEFLKRYGLSPLPPVASGEEAVLVAEKDRPAVILMDIVLSGMMDGIEAARIIRERSDIPIIFITAYPRYIDKALPAAMPYGYLVKPVRADELCTTVLTVLNRHTVDERLRQSEEKFRLLVENSADMIVSLDSGGLIRYVSPAAERMTGHSRESFTGREISGYLHPDDTGAFMEFLARIAEDKKAPAETEYRFRHKDGSWHWHMTTFAPRFDADGKFISYLGISRDLTERKQEEEALKNAHRQLNLMTAITRHDILNNIMICTACTDMLKNSGLGEKETWYLKKIEDAIQTITALVEFTKIYQELGSRRPQWQSVDAVLPKDRFPPSVSLSASTAGCEIHADLLLSRVFFNLLDNSLRHGGHVTRISAGYNETPEGLLIFWEDDGAGIPKENKDRIFERGFGKNTGLGLFLAREILAVTGISIRETGEPGKGARFEIVVPQGSYRLTGGTL
jgi:PAS domain S-box-containing protein